MLDYDLTRSILERCGELIGKTWQNNQQSQKILYVTGSSIDEYKVPIYFTSLLRVTVHIDDTYGGVPKQELRSVPNLSNCTINRSVESVDCHW